MVPVIRRATESDLLEIRHVISEVSKCYVPRIGQLPAPMTMSVKPHTQLRRESVSHCLPAIQRVLAHIRRSNELSAQDLASIIFVDG